MKSIAVILTALFLIGCASTPEEKLRAEQIKLGRAIEAAKEKQRAEEQKRLAIEKEKRKEECIINSRVQAFEAIGFEPDKYYYPVEPDAHYETGCKQYAKKEGMKDPNYAVGGFLTPVVQKTLNKQIYYAEYKRCTDIAKEFYAKCITNSPISE